MAKNPNIDYYYFVDVKDHRRVKPDIDYIIKENIGHDVFRNVYKMSVELITDLPIHIGSGKMYYSTSIRECNCIREHIKNEKRLPIIPASSLKGALSIYYLALFKDNFEVSKLFGAPGYLSRIMISDFIPKTYLKPIFLKFPPQWQPKKSRPPKIKLYKPISQLMKTEYKTCLECIPKNTIMTGKIIVVNSSITEIAKILIALGYAPEPDKQKNFLMIGYGKGKGLGRVRVHEQPRVDEYKLGLQIGDPTDRTDDVIRETKRIIEDLVNRGIWDQVYKSMGEQDD